MPAFGGNPTGRKSKFRFPAGTTEGDEERRKADTERKAAERAAAAKLVEPPPLPAAGLNGAAPPAVYPDASQTPAETSGLDTAPGRPVVPWTPDMLQELTDGIVDALEERRIEKFSGKARQAELPEKLIREISQDARYPVIGKKGLKIALPQVGAKLANKAGISAEHLPEVILAKAIALNLVSGRRLEARLDKLIAQNEAAKEQEKKKQAAALP